MNSTTAHPATQAQSVEVGSLGLPGELSVPQDARGQVLFAHGQGSNRLSTRNWWVAGVLHQHGLATLLFDLLSDDEPAERNDRFEVELMTPRVMQALDWVATRADLAGLGIGLFGAGIGAAAALRAAAARPAQVMAVVSRGGRPDLALDCLDRVQAPTLLIVGEADHDVLALNRMALHRLGCRKRLEVVPGAGHMFSEPGALASVAALAVDWFELHLCRGDAH